MYLDGIRWMIVCPLPCRSAASVEEAGENVNRAATIFGQTADLLEYSAKAAMDYVAKVKVRASDEQVCQAIKSMA